MEIAPWHGTSGPFATLAKLFFQDLEIHSRVLISQQFAQFLNRGFP